MLSKLGKPIAVLSVLVHGTACLLVVAMMLQISADVVLKYLTTSHIPANIEIISNYYMVGIAFLPLAFAEHRNGHISAEVLTRMLSFRTQKAALAFAWALSVLIYGILTYRSFFDAVEKHAIGVFVFSQGIRLDVWPAYYFLPIGFGLICLAVIYRLAILLLGGQDRFCDVLPIDADEEIGVE